ncbi:GNAT family N-acetyltransferase [Roseovarius faecimaris]|uniref:GNAT family N-acetyltransferase n=1 Tax=Roseovarius faecimaris TaxID=2494550 RepID=A0A6I6ISB9_9RHOB|nr:GNAT family N-acetyltransferase [Roseovarius faecimaris]QGX99969.1 GNAT family N-acetyltransferase [Roseovarius faecimaris]
MSVEIVPTEDLSACHAVRRAVFVEEQGVAPDLEQDGRDGEALHLLALDGDVPVGTARILIKDGTGKIGRVCVLPSHRGVGLGLRLIEACLDRLRALPDVTRAELGAQTYALDFYEALGFVAYGPVFDDAGGLPHRMMERAL